MDPLKMNNVMEYSSAKRISPASSIPVRRLVFSVSLLAVCLSSLPGVSAAENLGVKVPEGFKVELYADDNLAHDIYVS